MTLAAGTRLGPYEVIGALGSGGMGEVYRAKDSRLGRDVAVKVLPADFAADAERRRRFEQEARAASALNHPNIVSIYDIGTDGGVAYIAMELIEGTSLRGLADGPVSPRRVLEIAAPLADGLARAHAAGIVHRDLKPENVMISKDGFVKILDFGLAKATIAPKGDGSQMPTMDPATGAGTVLGTVAYMSPEQAAGRSVDHRSDQFSLATILYELLSGKKPFVKPTAVETMSAILREDPSPLSQSGASVPAPLRWIVDRCHAKDPDGRYASTLDLARELKDLRDHYSELSSISGTAMASTAGAPTGRRFGARQIALLGAALLVGAAAVRLLWHPALPEPPSLRYLTYAGQDSAPAASPDGRLLAFSSLRDGKRRIWLEDVANGTATALTAGPDSWPAFSPDGASVIFARGDATRQSLYRVATLGGEPRRVTDAAMMPAWSPDGRQIVFARLPNSGSAGEEILICDSDGGGERLLAAFANKFLLYPRWSPDGRTIAVGRSGSNVAPVLEAIVLIDAATGKTVKEFPAVGSRGLIYGLVWSSPTSVLYEAGTVPAAPGTPSGASWLWELPVSGGRPRRVFSLPAGGSALDIIADGSLVLDQISPRENLRSIPIGAGIPGEAPRWLTRGISTDRQPVISPDGKWVVFSSGRAGNVDIWKIAVATGEERRMTETAGSSWDPTFTPDGAAIYFSSNRTGSFEIWRADADGSHPVQITHEKRDSENPEASPDGRWVYFIGLAAKQAGTWRVHPDGTGIEFVADSTGVPEISRDGLFLATSSADGGIAILSTGSPKTLVAQIPPAFPGGSTGSRYRWLGRTHTLFFVGSDAEGHGAVFAQEIGDPSIPIRPKIVGTPGLETTPETFDVSPDGKTLVTAEQDTQANIFALDNVPGVKKPRRRE